MRSWTILFLAVLLVIFCSPAYAQTGGSVGLKVDYIGFTDGDLDDADVDEATYVALEGYKGVMGGLFQVGGELGFAKPEGSVNVGGVNVKSEFEFVPLEANAKFVGHLGEDLSYGVGLGLSVTFIEVDVSAAGLRFSEDDKLWGGQFFVEMNYALGDLILGVDAKYHLLESFKDDDYTNYRAGAHIGWTF